MSEPPPSDRPRADRPSSEPTLSPKELAQAKLRARAARIGRMRKRVIAASLATFVLAFGVIAIDGPMGATSVGDQPDDRVRRIVVRDERDVGRLDRFRPVEHPRRRLELVRRNDQLVRKLNQFVRKSNQLVRRSNHVVG